MSNYQRKLELIVNSSLKRYDGKWTDEQYNLELQVAKNMLTFLGIKP